MTAFRTRCVNCGRKTRHHDGLCQSCRTAAPNPTPDPDPIPEVEENPSTDQTVADTNGGTKTMKTAHPVLLGIYLIAAIAALIIFFPVLLAFGAWGIVAIIASILLIIGFTTALLLKLIPTSLILEWITKIGILLGASMLALALIIGFALPLRNAIPIVIVPTPTPATVLTPMPTAIPTIAPIVKIPTDGEMQAMFGFDKLGIKPVFSGSDIPWEPAKWQLQWIGKEPLTITLLEGWEFTVTRADNTVAVYYGDGTNLEIKGATMRYLAAYVTPDSIWAQDKAEMLKRERDFGLSRDPAYETVVGN